MRCLQGRSSVTLAAVPPLKSFMILIVLMTMVFLAQAEAATLNVDGANTGCSDTTGTPYCTIQAAIDDAVAADIVLVMPGTYQENINFSGKAITVRSDQGASATIIDGNRADTVAYFGNGETVASVLEGFTLRNGFAKTGGTLSSSGRGGGIAIGDSSPTIKSNIITDNIADSPGFGINIQGAGSSPIIDGNTISNNRTAGAASGGSGGGGIAIDGGGSAQIINNIISDNTTEPAFTQGGGIFLNGAGTPIIRNNIISGNTSRLGGGISMINGTNALIVQNLIVNNSAIEKGGGIHWGVPSGEPGPVLVNNTIAWNVGDEGSGVHATGFYASTQLVNNLIIAGQGYIAVYCDGLYDDTPPSFDSNNIYSASGTHYGGICTDQTGVDGNISGNPLFVNSANSDYRLNPGSLAIDAGSNAAPNLPDTDFAGNSRIVDDIVDMGAYEYSPNPGELEFTSSRVTVLENGSNAVFTIRRSVGHLGEVTVDVATSDRTATAGSDYTAVSATVTFADGDIEDKTISIPILDDATDEVNEIVDIALSNPTGGATLGTLTTAEIVIQDDESTSYQEGEDGPRTGHSAADDGKYEGFCFIETAFSWRD